MKRVSRYLLCLLILLPTTLRADVASEIQALLADKVLAKGQVGVDIVQLGNSASDSHPIFESKSTTPRIPASNLKLITTATALAKLGSDFQFKTTLAGRGQDLALIGDGDPSFGDAEMLRKQGMNATTVFNTWAEMLQGRGLKEIRNLYVDDSIFEESFVHPDWPADQQQKRYSAQVGGMNLNANCVDFFIRLNGYGETVNYNTEPLTAYIATRNTCVQGDKNAIWLSRQLKSNDVILRGETNANNIEPVSVTVQDPPMFAATVLSEVLSAHGIQLNGQVLRDRTIRTALNSPPSDPKQRWTPLAMHSSPLAAILSRANKDSMNLYAESMCKRVGAAVSGTSGSWENGTAAVGAYLESIGVARSEFNLTDGSGLSKKNQISPHAIVTVLEHKFFDADHTVYTSSLAIGGVDGTLETRFRDNDLRGRVFGKSGFVNGVRSLSGYLKAKDGHWYAFSILMNSLGEGEALSKQIQEKIVRVVDLGGQKPETRARGR